MFWCWGPVQYFFSKHFPRSSSFRLGSFHIFCSASGGSFWDRPAGCAWLFWIQSGRGLDCSTSMPRGGLDLSQQSPNRRKVGLWNSLVGGRRYVTLAKWVTEVGHWPPSSLGNFSVIKETYFCGANCVALLQCELFLRQLHLHKIHKSTDNSNWRIGSYSHFRDMSCQKTFVTFAPAATDAPNCEVIRQYDSCNTGELDRHAQHQQPCLASRTLRVTVQQEQPVLSGTHWSSLARRQMSVVLCLRRFPMKIENCHIRHQRPPKVHQRTPR